MSRMVPMSSRDLWRGSSMLTPAGTVRGLEDRARDRASILDWNGYQGVPLRPNDGTDCISGFNAAAAAGIEVEIPKGNYRISAPIDIVDGTVFKGIGHTYAGTNPVIITLAPGANCSMLRTPGGKWLQQNPAGLLDDAYCVHYIGLQNIAFAFNGANNSGAGEQICLDLAGLFVSSYVRDIMIDRVFGQAMAFDTAIDTELQNIRVGGICTSTAAVTFNHRHDARGGTVGAGNVLATTMYVENISKPNAGAWRDPYDVAGGGTNSAQNAPSVRGIGISAKKVGKFVIGMGHVESCTVGLDLDANVAVSLGSFGGAHVGYDSNPDDATANALIRVVSVNQRIVTGPLWNSTNQTTTRLVGGSATANASTEFVPTPAGIAITQEYHHHIARSDVAPPYFGPYGRFLNSLSLLWRAGNSVLKIFTANEESSPNSWHGWRGNGQYCEGGSQISGSWVTFFRWRETQNAGRVVEALYPLKLPTYTRATLTSAANVPYAMAIITDPQGGRSGLVHNNATSWYYQDGTVVS